MNKPLYEEDFFAWTQAQADVLRRRSANEIDWDNLLDEMESLGRVQRRELHNRLVILHSHILKWEMQPDRRGRSWSATIKVQQNEIVHLMQESPSLKSALAEIYPQAYADARDYASLETGYPVPDFERMTMLTFEDALAYAPKD